MVGMSQAALEAENEDLRKKLDFVTGLVERRCDTCAHEVFIKGNGAYFTHGCTKGYEKGLKCWSVRTEHIRTIEE